MWVNSRDVMKWSTHEMIRNTKQGSRYEILKIQNKDYRKSPTVGSCAEISFPLFSS